MTFVDLAAFSHARLAHEPYDHCIGFNAIRKDAIDGLRQDFPAIDKPGYLFVDKVKLTSRFKAFIEELEGPEVTEALSRRFGRDIHPYPRLTTIMKKSQPKYGAIHTDGPSKVMTMLIYMNDAWDMGEAERLRVLYDGTNYEPYAAEISPTMGTMFAFLRSETSWHGHRPFVGERRVIQVAWVKSQEDIDRKKKHNRAAQFFKGLFGR